MNKKYIYFISLFIIFIITLSLRFVNLGYSDYIGDEHKAFIQLEGDQTLKEFFLSRRKGPMQFLVSHIPYMITGDFRNELAQRVPFSVVSVLAVWAFYLLVRKISKNEFIALFSTLLFSINGFIVGFGRIAQYQNLNLLFSFLAAYFYLFLLDDLLHKDKVKKSLLGTLFFSLSVLSHWDAIFILPVIVITFIKYLKLETDRANKIKLIAYNFAFGCLLLLPFLIPYVNYQLNDVDNQEYFKRRIETGHMNFERYTELINLYNPFVTYYFLIIFGFIGSLNIKKSFTFLVWFSFSYLTFEIYVKKPGTHIYNFIIPLIILSSYGVYFIYRFLPKIIKHIYGLLIFIISLFLVFQTYFIFIDHSKEYPWEQKTIYNFRELQEWNYKRTKVKTRDRVYTKWETPEYLIDQKLPLFGFAHKRYWNQINDFVNTYNYENNTDFGYITNEVKTISEWYMDAKYNSDGRFFVVGIKRPLSFVNDWKMSQVGNKSTVHEIKDATDTTVVRIYLVND